MTIAIGDALPKATFRLVEPEGTRDVSVDEFFAGRAKVFSPLRQFFPRDDFVAEVHAVILPARHRLAMI